MTPISTVISFSTLEVRFLDAMIKEVRKFCSDIVVVAYDHFFDGTPENTSLLDSLVERYPGVHWELCEWDSQHDSKFWHNNARWEGAVRAGHNRVLFLDADEIPDGDLMRRWLEVEPLEENEAHAFSCFWYFRDPKFQATQLEICALLVDMSSVSKEMFFTVRERWFFTIYPFKNKLHCNLGGNVIFNHYSWVRTKEEMLTKVKSWAHRGELEWVSLVEKEFKGEFGGKDFVHGYSYNRVQNIFNL